MDLLRDPIVQGIASAIAIIAAIFGFIMWVRPRLARIPRLPRVRQIRWSLLIVTMFSLLVIGATGWFLVSPFLQQRTLYFLMDASDRVNSSDLKEISLKAKLNAASVPQRVDVGLAVFGGNLSGQLGCNDVKELVEPLGHDPSISLMNEQLDLLVQIHPEGAASIQAAAEFAIKRLSNRPGLHQIIILTTGIDPRCPNLDREALNKLARNSRARFEIIPITVGNPSEFDRVRLNEFAVDRYVELESLGDLPQLIKEILSDPHAFYNYDLESSK